ncbi:MAG: ABC transporter permease [Prevotellaceae bacterium]|jgi:ABC-type antimicrobial peptide transport system permease subunit|nr:ABC transporter permease [Prevotellaceae bacterium]
MYNSLKILLRNLYRNALYTWINVIGLAVSLTAAIFISLWVQDEYSYDRFYEQIDNMYVLVEHSIENGSDDYREYLPVPLARAVKSEVPEVTAATAVGYEWFLSYLDFEGNRLFGEFQDFMIADTTFFSVFDMEFVEGSPAAAFPEANSIILTDESAKILFGNETALGKLLKTNTDNVFRVSAVVKKAPRNSMLQFKAMVSFEQSNRKERWGQWTSRCLVVLNPNADINIVGKKIAEVHSAHNSGYKADYPYILQPLSKHHLYAADGSETGIKNVRIFIFTAISLLILACINYVNLVTARAKKRAKEVGLRKVMGANRPRLFWQMTVEAIALFFIAVIIAVMLLYLLTPYYRVLTAKELSFSLFDSGTLQIILISFLSVVIMAGIYPALFIASFKPVEAFKSNQSEYKSRFSFRRSLIVIQFTCSAMFILSTIVMTGQQRYMQTKNLGYEKENIFSIDILSNSNAMNHYEVIKQELTRQEGIAGVSGSEQNIMDVGNFAIFSWDGSPEDAYFSTATVGLDRNFFDMMNMEFISGHGFKGTPADSSYVFVNESLVRLMGVNDPLNTTISVPGAGINNKIVGVVRDFHFRHMSEPVGGIVMYLPRNYWTIYVKTQAGKVREAIAGTEKVWKQLVPDFPLTYKFMDETFDYLYQKDIRTGYLFNAFAIIAIFISCLGLFGLATYTAETRTKEIGIRKTLGANILSIVKMLSKEFIVLVGIAVVIGIPIALYFANKTLQSYAYRISVAWWMILLAILIVFVLVILTVSAQAVKAARANPVKAIKTE